MWINKEQPDWNSFKIPPMSSTCLTEGKKRLVEFFTEFPWRLWGSIYLLELITTFSRWPTQQKYSTIFTTYPSSVWSDWVVRGSGQPQTDEKGFCLFAAVVPPLPQALCLERMVEVLELWNPVCFHRFHPPTPTSHSAPPPLHSAHVPVSDWKKEYWLQINTVLFHRQMARKNCPPTLLSSCSLTSCCDCSFSSDHAFSIQYQSSI